MDDRTLIAAMAMEGILIGSYSERPLAKPPPGKIAVLATTYADALLAAIRDIPEPLPGPTTP